jgi:hypothetical protein
MCAFIVDQLISLLETPEINNSEFTNYWGVFDVSYSSYQGMSYAEKNVFIQEIVEEYLDNRHAIYQAHGYSPVALQSRCDSVAHKRSGQLGIRKIETLLAGAGLTKFAGGEHVDDFLASDHSYILTDSDGKKLFIEVLQALGLWFNWSRSHQNKFPDFAMRLGGRLYVVEHKHMKEGGGGQHKQIAELIDFIRQSDPVSYVSFLDGIYFNQLTKETAPAKTKEQTVQIRQALRANANNYFVNTQGFLQLLGELSE